MKSLETKETIARAFLKLAETETLEKVSVFDVAQACGKNRKTFYYHFADKAALIHWIFRYDIANQLESAVNEENLVYQNEIDSSDDFARATASLPYYTFIKDGVRSIDGKPFLQILARCLESRRAFYAQALEDDSPVGLSNYLFELYVPALERDIDFILSNRYLQDNSIRFLAEFHVGAVIDYFKRRCSMKGQQKLLCDVGPFGNIIHTSIAYQINQQQERRTL